MQMQNGTLTLENSFTFSDMFKHTLTLWSSKPIQSIYPREKKIYFHTKTIHLYLEQLQ